MACSFEDARDLVHVLGEERARLIEDGVVGGADGHGDGDLFAARRLVVDGRTVDLAVRDDDLAAVGQREHGRKQLQGLDPAASPPSVDHIADLERTEQQQQDAGAEAEAEARNEDDDGGEDFSP